MIDIPEFCVSNKRGILSCIEEFNIYKVTIPEGITEIWYGAFDFCSGLTSVKIPEGVTYIRSGAFYGCSGLTSVKIPEGVTHIEEDAFSECSGLTSVTIPEGVTYIEKNAFEKCHQLTIILLSDVYIDIKDVKAVFAKNPVPLRAEFPHKNIFSLNDMYYSPGRTLKLGIPVDKRTWEIFTLFLLINKRLGDKGLPRELCDYIFTLIPLNEW